MLEQPRQSWKSEAKLESHYLISRQFIKLHSPRQSAFGIRIENQISGTEWDSEINPYIPGQLIFDKGAMVIQW